MPVGRADAGAKDLGVPLRGRAFRSNLRFAPISTAIPDASVRSRSLRAPLGKKPGTPCSPTGHNAYTGLVILAPALCAALVTVLASLAPAGCAGRGHRSGSPRQHFVPRRCRLRRPPARAPRRAVASAQVRTAPPELPAACYARLPAAPAASPATHSPWRLPSAGFPGVDSPIALPRIRGYLDALRRFGFTPDASLMQRLPWLSMTAIGWLCPRHWRACRLLARRKYLPPIGARKRPLAARSRRLHRAHAAPSTFRDSTVLRQILLSFPASTYRC